MMARKHPVLLGIFVLGTLACGAGTPGTPAQPADAETGAQDTANSAVKKYDFLWVIDHSPSMSHRQLQLAAMEKQFVETLKGAGQIDVQMAVVTVQQIADLPSATGVTVKKIGEFRNTPASSFPPNSIEMFRAPCTADGPDEWTATSADCRNQFEFSFPAAITAGGPAPSLCSADVAQGLTGTGKSTWINPKAIADKSSENLWRCRSPGAKFSKVNDNCSINSYCWRHCTTDAECQNLFGQSAICYSPGGAVGADQAGCLIPPQTQDCLNKELPKVLHQDQLDLFHCLATVGASSTQQSGFEGGLRSAWFALDPQGPNCADAANCQNTQLIRKDATLVLVFVSDDDDCSVALEYSLANDTPEYQKKQKELLPADDWSRCQVLGDATGSNVALNEGNCLYIKSKQADPSTYLCPTDCLEGDAVCAAAAAKNLEMTKVVDKRFGPVAEFAAKFASLKDKPDQVIVAAFSGDSPVADFKDGKIGAVSPQVRVDRDKFYLSERVNLAPGQAPYICADSAGLTAYGSRYFQLAAAFGENGFAANLCANDLSTPLSQFAAFLAAKK